MSNGTKMLITDAGLAEIRNAEASGTAPVVLSHIAFGTGQYTATANMTALKAEFKRFDSVKGGAISDKVIHLSLHDNSTDTYSVYEVGVFTESGTLFGVYSKTTPIVQKAKDAEVMLVIDIALSDINVESVTVGDTNFILNPATTETKGIVELATESEAKAGTDATKAITPKTLDAAIEAHDNIVHKSGSETIAGPKTFSNNVTIENGSPRLNLDQTDITQGTAPATAQSNAISFRDSQNNTMGYMVHEYLTDGENRLRFAAYKPEQGSAEHGDLSVVYPPTGTPYATAPTPASGDNSTKIATTQFVNTKAGNYLPLAGGKMTNQNAIMRSVDNSYLSIMGGSSVGSGAQLDLCGKDHESIPSAFQLHARNGATDKVLVGETDGDLTWDGKHIVRSVNGVLANNAGNVAISSVAEATKATQDGNGKVIADTYLPLAGGKMTTTKAMTRDVNNSYLALYGGTGEGNDGAHIDLCGANHSSMPGTFQIHARNSSTDKILRGEVDGDLTWDSKTVLTNSTSMPGNASGIVLNGGTDYESGGYIRAYGKDHATYPGWFTLGASDGVNTSALRGLPDGTLTWNGKSLLETNNLKVVTELPENPEENVFYFVTE